MCYYIPITNTLSFIRILQTQQDYYGQRYITLLQSYHTGTYTKVIQCCSIEVAPLLPWGTHVGTPTEQLCRYSMVRGPSFSLE